MTDFLVTQSQLSSAADAARVPDPIRGNNRDKLAIRFYIFVLSFSFGVALGFAASEWRWQERCVIQGITITGAATFSGNWSGCLLRNNTFLDGFRIVVPGQPI